MLRRMMMAGASGGGGSDPNWASVSSLLHFDGTDGSTTFTDQKGKTWTAAGNAQIDTAQSKFGGASVYFDGSGDWLTAASSSDFGFGTGDFTLEMFARTGVKDGVFFDWRVSSPDAGVFFINSTGVGYFDSSVGNLNTGFDIADSNWHHLAFARASGTLRVFIDGGVRGSWSVPTSMGSSRPMRIGASFQNTANFNGHIDEVRITKGVARYTANFTPPAAAFPDS